jgi:malate dehydrogenase (oxaloacetate-decarboxylating)(NADP+)
MLADPLVGMIDSARPEARIRPDWPLSVAPSLLIMPSLDAANITFNCLMTAAREGVTVGADPARRASAGAHPDAPSTVRRLVNMAALTAIEARCHTSGG